MFWDIFEVLCIRCGKSPSAVAAELGLSNSTTTAWKNGSMPRAQTLQRVAKYFNVPANYLLGEKYLAPDEGEAERQEFIRLYQAAPAWLQDQVRALLRAAESGDEVPGAGPKG